MAFQEFKGKLDEPTGAGFVPFTGQLDEPLKKPKPIQSEPILSPEDLMMGAVGAPTLEPPPQPRKPVVPVEALPSQPMTAEQYKAAVAKRERETPARSISDATLDAGISLLKGVIGLPEAFVGLADIPTMGRVGKFLEESQPLTSGVMSSNLALISSVVIAFSFCFSVCSRVDLLEL